MEKQISCRHQTLETIDKLDWVTLVPMLNDAKVVHCQTCGYMFTEGYPTTQEKIRELNNALDISFEIPPARSKAKAEVLNRLFSDLGLSKGRTIVLDYGGGTGRTANELRRVGWESYSYDPFARADGAILENIAISDEGLSAFKASSGVGRRCVVTLFHVLEHIPDPVQFLLDLQASFGTNALFVIEVPVLELDFEQSWDPSSFFAPFHASHFSRETLSMTLKSAGLEKIIQEEFSDYNGHLVIAETTDAIINCAPNFELNLIGLSNSESINRYMALRQQMEDWLISELEEIYSSSEAVIFWGLGLGLDSIFRIWQPTNWKNIVFLDRNKERVEAIASRYPKVSLVATPNGFLGSDFYKVRRGSRLGIIPSSYAKSREITAEATRLFSSANPLSFLDYPLVRSY